jgi:hypothetical protein
MEINADMNGLTSRCLNGWEAGISGNFNRWFAAEAEFAFGNVVFSAIQVGAETNLSQ